MTTPTREQRAEWREDIHAAPFREDSIWGIAATLLDALDASEAALASARSEVEELTRSRDDFAKAAAEAYDAGRESAMDRVEAAEAGLASARAAWAADVEALDARIDALGREKFELAISLTRERDSLEERLDAALAREHEAREATRAAEGREERLRGALQEAEAGLEFAASKHAKCPHCRGGFRCSIHGALDAVRAASSPGAPGDKGKEESDDEA